MQSFSAKSDHGSSQRLVSDQSASGDDVSPFVSDTMDRLDFVLDPDVEDVSAKLVEAVNILKVRLPCLAFDSYQKKINMGPFSFSFVFIPFYHRDCYSFLLCCWL